MSAIFLVVAVIALGSVTAVAVNSGGTMKNWNEFDSLFKKYGGIYGVDWQWLKAIALNESSLGNEKSVRIGLENPSDIENSKSYDGKSWGLMQVTLSTAKALDPTATAEKLNNAEYSINSASKLLSQLKPQFSTSDSRYVEYVIKSYNQGPGNTRKYEVQGLIRPAPWGPHVQEYWERFQRNLAKVKAG